MSQDYRNFEHAQIMWQPDGNVSEKRKIFEKHIEDKYHVKIDNYWDLHKWSIENLEELWAEVWDHGGIIYSRKYEKIIDLNVPMNKLPKWFEGAKLNFAENLLKNRDTSVAMIIAGEERKPTNVTHAEVYEKAKLYAAAFRKFGIKKNDVVTCFMSNREEPIYAMLGAVSIGCIWTGALPLIGAEVKVYIQNI
ncbi:acetoacetyl-CoA synthetase [Nephila pilipes]|uniref:Acetoacetyl-CoA synthetase n=1 Tax=Nephila pilipes TaxID=299642 RepID=A0A8X6R0A3_NEPPI|nr:acetoacetyl-CoA synthetase [Nephila pilipes]